MTVRTRIFLCILLGTLAGIGFFAHKVSGWRVQRLDSVYAQTMASQISCMASMLCSEPFEQLYYQGEELSEETQRFVSRTLDMYSRTLSGNAQFWVLFCTDPENAVFTLGPCSAGLKYPIVPDDKVFENPPPQLLAAFAERKAVSFEQALPNSLETIRVSCVPIFHPITGKPLFLLAANNETMLWQLALKTSAKQTYLLFLPLTLTLVFVIWLIFARGRVGRPANRFRYAEVLAAVLVVLSLLFPLTTLLREGEVFGQASNFLQQMEYLVHRLANRVSGTENKAIKTIDRIGYFTGELTSDIFNAYLEPFQLQGNFTALCWVARVDDKDREIFENTRRADFDPTFEIWEHGSDGNPVRAAQRDAYYPIWFAGDELYATGFDYAGDPARYEALERAMRTRRTTVSRPMELVLGRTEDRGVLIVHPVLPTEDQHPISGFLVMPMRLANTLQSLTGIREDSDIDHMLLIDFFRLHPDGNAEYVASSMPSEAKRSLGIPPLYERLRAPEKFAFYLPLILYDTAFVLCIHAGDAFIEAHPLTTQYLIMMTACIGLPILCFIVFWIRRSQLTLEALVEDCTFELSRQNERLMNITENVPAVLWELDLLTKKYTYLSKFSRNYVSVQVGEPLEIVAAQFYPPDSAQILQNYKEHFESGETFTQEYRLLNQNSGVCWMQEHVTFIFEGDKPIRAIGITSDVTERKTSAQETADMDVALRKAQRLEAVGLLAGGIAHDFNNMLQVILGNVELILSDLDEENKLYNDILEIQNSAQKATGITRQLLAFARKQTFAPEVLDLNTMLRANLAMLRKMAGEDVTVNLTLSPVPCMVKVDPAQMVQVLSNLVVNARDAIHATDVLDSADAQGLITLAVSCINLQKTTWVSGHTADPGPYVRLIITDNGCGMDEAVISKMFDPFFSTKAPGEGTGLGLSSVHGIITQNKGGINVQSSPGNGTSFMLYLPQHLTGEVSVRAKVEKVSVKDIGGTGTIIVVEDEESILKLTRATLMSLGYNVIAINHSPDIKDVLEDKTRTIDLILSDMIMPIMNGMDVRKLAAQLRPEVPVVFMSGYTAEVFEDGDVKFSDVKMLHKPFNRESLARHIREALEQKDKQADSSS